MERKRKRTTTASTPNKDKKNFNSGIGIDNSHLVSEANSSGEDVAINYGLQLGSTPDLNASPNVNAYNPFRDDNVGFQVSNPAPINGDGYDLTGLESSFDMPPDMMAAVNGTFMQTLDQSFQSSGWGAYMNGPSDMGLLHSSDHHQDIIEYPTHIMESFDGSGIGLDLAGQGETAGVGLEVVGQGETAGVGVGVSAAEPHVKDEQYDDFVSFTPGGEQL
jgi:hypothetical protein